MATIGIEWVNQYHGRAGDLSNNDNNAEGFYKKLSGVKSFNWGDDLARDQDFESSGTGSPSTGTDTAWIDNVDIAFFSGHGSPGGILFGRDTLDDGWAKNTEVRLGDYNLEWIVFDACQVLEFSGVFDRWGWPVFQGLHYILGFHTTCLDVGDRGEKFADRLNNGWSIRDAWIRACQETESASTELAYLRADNTSLGTDTFNDHWWGQGSVSGDPFNPNILFHLRTTC